MSHIDIPFDKITLPNGLRVVVHHDDKAPIVTVSVWYHVGSKNEVPGKTGFAHLFEHLMFEGSAHHDDEYFRPLEQAGASTINGTTNRDRTNYFETVPSDSLDLALWLESDRMGHLLPAMTQEKLDEQRDVVRNEKKESDNQPYGRVWELLSASLYPSDHPYSWPIIGRLEDLDGANLEDVQNWFKTWYGPNNAVVVVSGDVDAQHALQRVDEHFGSFESGPPLARPREWIAPLAGPRQVELEDRVPQARLYRAWNVPAAYHDDHRYLGLLARVLSHGKTSRLYRRFVYDEQIATDVSAYLWSGEIGSSFVIQISCAPDAEPETVDRALDEELERLYQDGIGEQEIQRAQRRALAGFVRGLEHSGGYGGKSEVLAHGEVFRHDPAAFLESLEVVRTARPVDLEASAATWLGSAALSLLVRPVAERAPHRPDVDRAMLPMPTGTAAARLPFPESHRLDNGLEVLFLERRQPPLAHLRLTVDAGFAGDVGLPRGTATLAMAAIDEGTEESNALDISDRVAGLGARLFCGAGLDQCRLGLSTLSETAAEAIELLAEIALRPSFPEVEIDRLKKEQTARIRREQVDPVRLAMRVLPQVLYGPDHPYSMPFTGSGSVEDVAAIGRAELVEYHDRWIRPQRASLICLGDLDRDAVLRQAEELLGDWQRGVQPENVRPPAPSPVSRRILLMDRPGSIHSIVFGGQLAPPVSDASELPLEAFHEALGGTFTSRLNMNLREDKGWTYGAHTLLWSARGQRPLLLYSSVQADATAAAIREMDTETRGMLGERPITAEELDLVQRQLIRSLPARRETLSDVASDIEEIIACELPRDYYDLFADRVAALTPDAVTDAARQVVDPDHFVWIVVGDLSTIRDQIDDLGWSEPEQLDADGTPIG